VKSATFEIVERADVMPQGSVAQPLVNDVVVRCGGDRGTIDRIGARGRDIFASFDRGGPP
jgi:hypothetical protein